MYKYFLLVAPCHQAMQIMLNTVEDFAKRFNISFSTDPNPKKSKSKCIHVIGKKRGLRQPPPLELCGNYLPWVSTADHLGHHLHESGLQDFDAVVKRSMFIARSVEIQTMYQGTLEPLLPRTSNLWQTCLDVIPGLHPQPNWNKNCTKTCRLPFLTKIHGNSDTCLPCWPSWWRPTPCNGGEDPPASELDS